MRPEGVDEALWEKLTVEQRGTLVQMEQQMKAGAPGTAAAAPSVPDMAQLVEFQMKMAEQAEMARHAHNLQQMQIAQQLMAQRQMAQQYAMRQQQLVQQEMARQHQMMLQAQQQAIPTEFMNQFIAAMNAQNYPQAEIDCQNARQALSNTHPRRDNDIFLCVNYAFALKLIMRIKLLEAQILPYPQHSSERQGANLEMALLATNLAALPLLPRHHYSARLTAVHKSAAVDNYATCMGLLEALMETSQSGPQMAQLGEKVRYCHMKGARDLHPMPNRALCFNTLQLISNSQLACRFCPAVFDNQRSGLTGQQACPYCLIGTLY